MKKSDIVNAIFQSATLKPVKSQATAYAPTNIALCKYWGKRNSELNIPMTSSISVALPDHGATVTLKVNDGHQDAVVLNGNSLASDSSFVNRLVNFLNLFRRNQSWFLDVAIQMNIPVAAGLASSACGFAAIVLALKDLLSWNISTKYLSILARLGSGSASRSLWDGFVEWHAGVQADGMDSYAEPIKCEWPELCLGMLMISEAEKPISSREAMQRTVDSSILYTAWPKKVARDLVIIRQSLQTRNFTLLAGCAESNALSMHATMMSAWPPILYSLPETIEAMHRIWRLRGDGLSLYFTQDAGPNLKLLFQAEDTEAVKKEFPQMQLIRYITV